jgi:glycosyltransferase involved in cell wall biosynthesis
MNKPVIATNYREIPQMLSSPKGTAGILIPLKNGIADIDELYKAMLKLASENEFYRILQKNTKEAFKKFSMDNCANKYLDIFKSLV